MSSSQCTIPFHLQDRFKNEIAKMETAGIIEERTGPTPWILNPVLATQDDEVYVLQSTWVKLTKLSFPQASQHPELKTSWQVSLAVNISVN